jgi:hypothetical protein
MSKLARDITGHMVSALGLGVTSALAFTGTSAQSAVVGENTFVVRLVATEPCFVAIGANPTATVSSAYLPAGVVEYFAITPGHRVAALQASSGGTLYVTQTV